ncbi:MAG: hypothetical protein FJ265_05120 [Planctomycetes bacterium]|nr:hypothetical protein [Planctomycetota bacterium]
MDTPELGVIGLTCNVVGVFFLANSIRFRDQRKALEDVLGVGGRSLLKVRDTALNNMQVIIGFLFLTTGFLLQVVARWDRQWTTLIFCAGIILFACAVYAIGAYSSRRAFKKLLREFFQSQPWSFTDDMELTKEIGEALGVPHGKDMTVEAYAHRVRQALGVQHQPKPGTPADRARRIALPGR